MAQRSMIMYALTFNERMRPEEKVYPRDIEGKNLLEIFEEWCKENKDAPLHRASSDDWVWIKELKHDEQNNVACVEIQTGKAGEAGELVDTSAAEPNVPFSELHAPTVDARVLLFVPPKCDAAYACVEHVIHGGSDTFFLESFKRGFIQRFSKITLKRERVIESIDLWEKFDGMSELEVRFMSPSKDIADGPRMEAGFLSYSLKHRRSKRFPMEWFNDVKKNPQKALEYVLPNRMPKDDLDNFDHEIYVTLTDNNGEDRRFAIDRLPSIPFRQILPNGSDNQDKMADDEFMRFCVKACKDVMKNEGYIPM